ncbi:GNAT family N-acetyltransferase [Marivita sp. XM-24bin2]|jgi:GNAT superfamily N-acetyltransferase|uniref:GNAT family N-acetyltransferase n=1 Tax=unclassified Marivita TaxID=2632480 RepID=UPI0025C23960|nr:GNAT family N-acetyltransferase [Marivita sp. XM-24bin2]MCR9110986.1 GNAT family N-acetyltransferase [Paracoccaceae bacterium]
MEFDIEMAMFPPERKEMNAILQEYYEVVIARLVADGGPYMTPEGPIEDFWRHISEFLPPKGRLALARGSQRELVGCGTLADIGNGKGELKRLFVRTEARGTGLGRRLVEARIAEARVMGLSTLLGDTLRLNVEMRALYAKLGFRETPPHPESGTLRSFPELSPFMIFLRLDIS